MDRWTFQQNDMETYRMGEARSNALRLSTSGVEISK